jgi:hypothetical protein
MKIKEVWQAHLRELISARLDPTVYAVRWANDPRCLRTGLGHRRVGEVTTSERTACRLWSLRTR